MSSKLERIKSYLASGRSLTPAEAVINGLGFRLAARIHDLRKRGVPVVTEIRTSPATGDKYAAYRLPRIGDHIRCTKRRGAYYSEGDVGTIVGVFPDGCIWAKFKTKRGDYRARYVAEGHFEVITND